MATTIQPKSPYDLRSGPANFYKTIGGTLVMGNKYTVCSTSNNSTYGTWYKLKVGTKVGWAPSTQCTEVPATTSSGFSPFIVTINTSYMTKTGPSPGHADSGLRAAKNAKLQVVAISGSWYKVKYGSQEGWIPANYCTKKEAPASSSSSSGGSGGSGGGGGGGGTSSVDTPNDGTVEDDVEEAPTEDELARAQAIADKITAMVNGRDAQLRDLANNASMRLFGLPHQLIAHNDRRISGTSNLGRMFTETFILDAPLLYLKPGGTNFLPGLSKAEKYAYTALFGEIDKGNDVKKEKGDEIKQLMDEDDLRYFDFTQKVAVYMSQVNTLCRIGAVFADISSLTVPWANGNATYANYDWRLYTFGSKYNSVAVSSTARAQKAGILSPFIEDCIESIDSYLEDDTFVQFYIDASSSFSETASNSTTQSILNQFTDQLSSMGKELSFMSAAFDLPADDFVNSATSGLDELVSGSGLVPNFLQRLVGTSSQLLAGSNFLAPDVWDSSDYGKSYSFAVTLATPYGNKEAWYINIYVPLMHILAMGLPCQTSANTFSAPFIVQAFAPGWFSCDLGIIDSIAIDKGGSGDAWSSLGLPNEIKVSVSIKDLYSNLALPSSYNIKHFFNNTGLIDFLMVNCGVDITKTGLSDKLGVFANLFANTIGDLVKETVYGAWYGIQENLRSVISLYS